MSGTNDPFLHDRPLDPAHSCTRILKPQFVPGDVETTAVLDNWAIDHRVTDSAHFEYSENLQKKRIASVEQFQEEMVEYCKAFSPAFRSDVRFAGPSVRMPPSRRLFHVWSFGGLLRLLAREPLKRETANIVIEDALGIPNSVPSVLPASNGREVNLISERLNQLGDAAFRATIFDLLNLLEPTCPPWWAGLESEVKGFETDAKNLASFFGLGY